MKIITIGDLHGRSCWKKAVNKEYDKVVFIGDYVDEWSISNEVMKQNLLEVIEYKKQNPEKVILLLGNHDIHYIHFPEHRCTGFRPEMQIDFAQIFGENHSLFDVAFQIDNHLWTHAGIHEDFYRFKIEPNIEKEDKNLADTLNRMYAMNRPELFEVGHLRGGTSAVGGIFWADKQLTSDKPLREYYQIVGHTMVDEIKTFKKDESTSITFCDCLHVREEFYEIERYHKIFHP